MEGLGACLGKCLFKQTPCFDSLGEEAAAKEHNTKCEQPKRKKNKRTGCATEGHHPGPDSPEPQRHEERHGRVKEHCDTHACCRWLAGDTAPNQRQEGIAILNAAAHTK